MLCFQQSGPSQPFHLGASHVLTWWIYNQPSQWLWMNRSLTFLYPDLCYVFAFIPGELFLFCKSYSLHEVYPEHVTLERILMVLFLCIYLIFSTKPKTCWHQIIALRPGTLTDDKNISLIKLVKLRNPFFPISSLYFYVAVLKIALEYRSH